jgi:S1-C subfamily serine protease
LLGSGAKYSEGVISALTGVRDDPRHLQISAAIQPGSSGSPLFDEEGNVVGVVVATIDAAYLYQYTEALPQNVNFAIKADYLINLIEMLPDRQDERTRKSTGVEDMSRCVVQVHTKGR